MTKIDGISYHNFLENNYHSKDIKLCFTSKKPKNGHLDYYIPVEFLEYSNYNFNDDIISNNIINNININL